LTETRGTGIINHSFFEYEPFKGEVTGRRRGVLIAMEPGTSLGYSLNNLMQIHHFLSFYSLLYISTTH